MSKVNCNKHILLILSGGSAKPIDLINTAMGLTEKISVILDRRIFERSEDCFNLILNQGSFLCFETYGAPEEILMLADKVNNSHELESVLALSEPILIYAAMVADKYNLKNNSVKSIKVSQSKFLQRDALQRDKIPSAKFSMISSIDDIKKAIEHVGFPGILKPVCGISSFLVSRIENEPEFIEKYVISKLRFDEIILPKDRPLFIYEEFLVGHSNDSHGSYVSVESLIDRGNVNHITITDKLGLTKDFIELGHVVPSRINGVHKEEIYKYVEGIISSVGLTDGVTHVELMLTKEGPRLIEVNARIGGPIVKLLSSSSDFDILDSVCRIALDLEFNSHITFKETSVFKALTFSHDNFVIEYSDIDQVKLLPFIKDFFVRFKSGSVLNSTMEGIQSSRVYGTFITVGDSLKTCLNNIERVEKLLDVTSLDIGIKSTFDKRYVQVCFTRAKSYLTDEVIKMISNYPKIEFVLVTTVNDLIVSLPPNIKILGANIYDKKKLKSIIEKIHSQRQIDFINTICEGLIEDVGEISKNLEIEYSLKGFYIVARDKLAMKRYFNKINIETADFIWTSDVKIINNFLKEYKHIIAKHRRKSGSREIYSISSEGDLNLFLSKHLFEIDDFIFEQFICGEVYCINNIFDGVHSAYSQLLKYIESPLESVDSGVTGVLSYDGMNSEKIQSLNDKLLKNFVGTKVVTHNEFVVEDGTNKVFFIEMAMRPPGGLINYASNFFENVNFKNESFKMSLDKNYKFDYSLSESKCWGYLGIAKQAGKILSITDESKFKELNLSSVIYDFKLGDIVAPKLFSNQTVAKFLLEKKTQTEFYETIHKIINTFDYTTAPVDINRKYLAKINW